MSRTNPLAATASPVNEFSSEMSTGTSAPPMGSTKMTPKHQGQDRATTQTIHVPGARSAAMPETDDGGSHDAVDDLLARVGDRPAGHQLLELGEGDGTSRERDAADEDAEQYLDDLVDGERPGRVP